jgi:hypothetical protein
MAGHCEKVLQRSTDVGSPRSGFYVLDFSTGEVELIVDPEPT